MNLILLVILKLAGEICSSRDIVAVYTEIKERQNTVYIHLAWIRISPQRVSGNNFLLVFCVIYTYYEFGNFV